MGPTETAAAARPRKRSAPESAVPDAPPSGVPNDEEVIGAIILASRVMVAIAVRSLAGNPDDVTLPQYRTLVELTFGGPRRLADLAEALSVSPSTATRMCDRLVRKELVSRTRDELDRREVKLAITGPGPHGGVRRHRAAKGRGSRPAPGDPGPPPTPTGELAHPARHGGRRGSRAPLGPGLVLVEPSDPSARAGLEVHPNGQGPDASSCRAPLMNCSRLITSSVSSSSDLLTRMRLATMPRVTETNDALSSTAPITNDCR